MAENPQQLTSRTIKAIQSNAKATNNTATAISNAMGVPITRLGIVSRVGREMNKDEIDYPLLQPLDSRRPIAETI